MSDVFQLFGSPVTLIAAGLGVFFIAMAFFRTIHGRSTVTRPSNETPQTKPFSISDPFAAIPGGANPPTPAAPAAPAPQPAPQPPAEALFRKLTPAGTIENFDSSHQDASYVWE